MMHECIFISPRTWGGLGIIVELGVQGCVNYTSCVNINMKTNMPYALN